ncbi:MAG: hypothetical protein JJT85_11215 [Chromatiales bacterium]|nr:hypothetical protein [Chromatiales bacterium]
MGLPARIIGGWLALALLVALPAAEARQDQATKLYRWVDDEGITRIGQFLPPEFAGRAHEVLNERGIVIRRVPQDPVLGDPEVMARENAEREAAERVAVATARRDSMLLSAYLSVADIEALRDQRVEMMKAQITVTENFLGELRERLARLQREARRFQPYNEDPEAPPIDERLAGELSDTMASILLYEQNLVEARERKAQLASDFAADIERFRELTARQ